MGTESRGLRVEEHKHPHRKWKDYREKSRLLAFLIFLNIKMSAKSKKIELSDEFIVMWREE